MTNISYEYIQFLNEKVLEFLPHNYVRVGDKLNMRCPICGDSHKSARKKRGWYYLKNASFYCFNCSTGMSGIHFLEHISGNSYDQIKKEYFRLCFKHGVNIGLSSYYDVPKTEPGIFEVQSIVKPEWKMPLSEKALEYLKNRKVTEAPFYKDPLYSCYTKKQDEFIMIPWRLNGVDAYYQLNDFQKLHGLKYIFPKDKKKLIAGLDNIDLSWNKIILTEGVYDSLFIPNCCATGTKSITDFQLKLIAERYPDHYKNLVISFDCDEPGISAMIKLIKENRPFKYFIWWNKNIMSNCKDINEFILQKNNPNYFVSKEFVDTMIFSPLQTKMFLIKNNLWNSNILKVNNIKQKSLSPNFKRL